VYNVNCIHNIIRGTYVIVTTNNHILFRRHVPLLLIKQYGASVLYAYTHIFLENFGNKVTVLHKPCYTGRRYFLHVSPPPWLYASHLNFKSIIMVSCHDNCTISWLGSLQSSNWRGASNVESIFTKFTSTQSNDYTMILRPESRSNR